MNTHKIIIILLLFVLFFFELLFLKNISTKESHSIDIGKYIKSITDEHSTMFLEPIGYIPYFAKRYVYCEVGLVTPEVTEYRKKYGNQNFHKHFLKDKKPTIIVSRTDLFNLDNETKDFPIDQKWLKDNYIQKKHFIYAERNTDNLNSFEILLGRYSEGVSDIYIYKKIIYIED